MSQSTLPVRAGDPDTLRTCESGIRTRLVELAAAGLAKEDDERGFSAFVNSAEGWATAV